ncbi:urease accessory protein UreD [Arenibacterium sp. CAU 1754]
METDITIEMPLIAAQPVPVQPRAKGVLRVSSKRAGNASVLDDLYQSGASKLLFPRTASPALTAVSLNTAGGMTGGDRFENHAKASTNSELTLTTQAAERIYRAQTGHEARIATDLRVSPGARLNWLPQETILFNQSALRRRLTAELATDAKLLMVEPIVFGRTAMGETVTQGHLRDVVRIRRDGALIFADATRLEGEIDRHLTSSAIAGKAGAMANILYAAPDAERFLPALRALVPGTGGVSLIRPGVLFGRLLAADSYLMRQTLIPMIQTLLTAPLPKTWTL